MVKLISNSLIFGFGTILTKLLSLFLLPFYSRHLTSTEYGVSAVLTTLGALLTMLLQCGISSGMGRFFYFAEEEGGTKAQVVWSPFIFLAVVGLLAVIPLILLASPLSQVLLGTGNWSILLILTGLDVLISLLSYIGLSVLLMEEKPVTVNLLNCGRVVIGGGLGIWLVVVCNYGLIGVFVSNLIANLVVTGVQLVLSLGHFKPSFSMSVLKKQLAFSLPLMFGSIAFWIMDVADRLIMVHFLPLSEVGFYNIGYQFSMIIMVLVTGFSQAWPPYYLKRIAAGEGQEICSPVLHNYIFGGGLLLVAISVAVPFVVRVLTPVTYHQSPTIVPWVALAYFLRGHYLVFIIGLQYKKLVWLQGALDVPAAILNIAANWVLIPLAGREAAAWATLASFLLMAVGSHFFVQRYFPVPGLKPIRLWTETALFGLAALIGAQAAMGGPLWKVFVALLCLTGAIGLCLQTSRTFRVARPRSPK